MVTFDDDMPDRSAWDEVHYDEYLARSDGRILALDEEETDDDAPSSLTEGDESCSTK